MNDKKKTIAWIIRIVIFGLFILSAFAKLYKSFIPLEPAIWPFEKQLVDLGICEWCTSHYLARFIIGFELALGLAMLQPYLLKKLVIPVTILLLVAFNIHLGIQMAEYGAMNGNCGCFGELIPMTPLEAFIKNLITIGLLVWLHKLLNGDNEYWSKFWNLLAIFFGSVLLVFVLFPFCPCSDEKTIDKNFGTGISDVTNTFVDSPIDNAVVIENKIDGSTELKEPNKENQVTKDTTPTKPLTPPIEVTDSKNKTSTASTQTKIKNNTANTVTPRKIEPKEEKGPKAVVSRFAQVPVFDGKTVKVDEGKKILCMFAPGCDHCQNTAKALGELGKTAKIPPVYIYFMDEEVDKIPEFFKIAGVTYPSQILSIGNFWDLLGKGSTPGVFGLWNGNIMQSYEGINENEFDIEKFKKFALPKK